MLWFQEMPAEDVFVSLDQLTAALWLIKDGDYEISVTDMADFCLQFDRTVNLSIDALNSLVYKADSVSEDEARQIVGTLRKIQPARARVAVDGAGGRSGYHRLVVDTLLVLMDHECALTYLGELLDSESAMNQFRHDFEYHPRYNEVVAFLADS